MQPLRPSEVIANTARQFQERRQKAAGEKLVPIRVNRPLRNHPCPCGSKKKFKQCCQKATV